MHRESDLVNYEFYSINPPMKLNMKSGKLGMLTVLAIVIYAVMILSSFISEMDDFMLGYEMGSNLGRSITDSTKQESAMKTVYFLDLKAGESISTFPDTIYNLKGAQKIPIRFDKAQILADAFSKDDKSALRLMKQLEIPLSLLMLVIVVLIPVFFIKLNISLKKEVVFDKSNIKCMRWIGILLILYYFVMLTVSWIIYKTNLMMFEFAEYKIQFKQPDLIWILLGVIVLLFAEVLYRGSKMKDEQDLTI